MKKSFLICLIALLVFSACAEPVLSTQWIPEDAEIMDEHVREGMRILLLERENGEQLQLTEDAATDEILSLITTAAAASENSGMQQRETAEAALLETYPESVVFSAEYQGNALRLMFFSEFFFGSADFLDDGIISRSIQFGDMLRNGYLTAEGARGVLSLLRPEAVIEEIELDEDDGYLVYEGEAWLGGVEYEFEIGAGTGKLLEWDRD